MGSEIRGAVEQRSSVLIATPADYDAEVVGRGTPSARVEARVDGVIESVECQEFRTDERNIPREIDLTNEDLVAPLHRREGVVPRLAAVVRVLELGPRLDARQRQTAI